MSLRPLALASLVLLARPALADEAKPAPQPETRMALTGDFVELGTGHPAVVRGSAALEIVNRTPHPIDVRLGDGSGRIETGKSLLVRIDAGSQPLRVSSPKAPGDVLEGVLDLKAGRAYALGIAWESVLAPGVRGPAAAPRSDDAAKSGSSDEKTEKGEVQPDKRKKSGRVDVGRKRKKDR